MENSEERKRIEYILTYAVSLWHLYYVSDWLNKDFEDLGGKCKDDLFLSSFDGSMGEKISAYLPDASERIHGSRELCRELAYGMEDMVKSALRDCRTVIPEVYGRFADQLTDDEIDKIYEYLCESGFAEAFIHCPEEIFYNLSSILRTRAFYVKATILSKDELPDLDDRYYFPFEDGELPFCGSVD